MQKSRPLTPFNSFFSIRIDIHPRHPFADPAENFIGNGTDLVRPLFGADEFITIPTEQGHAIAHLDIGEIGDIDENPVHANRACDRSPAAADQDIASIGQQAVVTIGVANRDRCNPGVARGHEPVAIGDPATRGNVLELGNPADQAQHRLLRESSSVGAAGQSAIEANPGTDQVASGKAATINPGAVGDMTIAWIKPMRFHPGAHLGKRLELCGGQQALRLIGHGQMTHDSDHVQAVQATQGRERFVESAEMILKGLETGVCAYDGKFVKQPEAAIRPAPCPRP